MPDFSTLEWKYLNTLPETEEYGDGQWTECTLSTSNNPRQPTTPFSLYASDYGYHGGSLIYRGHFIAEGNESTLFLSTQGGNAFGNTVYLNSTHLGSWVGSSASAAHNQTFQLPQLVRGSTYVITALIDHMGLDMNFAVNSDTMKTPRGILDHNLDGQSPSDILWKMTGNLGGENYKDLSRGPLNEGALFAERQGFHLPGANTHGWESRSPLAQGLNSTGVGFFATTFSLQIPKGWDVPMSLHFTNQTIPGTSEVSKFRVQFFVNGWQFGKYGMPLTDIESDFIARPLGFCNASLFRISISYSRVCLH